MGGSKKEWACPHTEDIIPMTHIRSQFQPLWGQLEGLFLIYFAVLFVAIFVMFIYAVFRLRCYLLLLLVGPGGPTIHERASDALRTTHSDPT